VLQGARTVVDLLATIHSQAELNLIPAVGAACAVNVPNAELLHCIQKVIEQKRQGETTAEQEAAVAAEADLASAGGVATSTTENADQAASVTRAELLAEESSRISILRTASGRAMALTQPDAIVLRGYLGDRLTLTYRTPELCISVTACGLTRYVVRANGQVEVVERTVAVSAEVVDDRPLGAPSANDEFAVAEGLGSAPGELDTSLQEARSLRLLGGAARLLRVGGWVVGLVGASLDAIEAAQAFATGDKRTGYGDAVSAATLLATLFLTDFVIGFAITVANGVGFLVAFAGMIALNWLGPSLAKALTEWSYDQITGHGSNVDSPFAEVFAPDIYVTNGTGGQVAVTLQLRTAGTFDVSPAWDMGTWNAVVEPDGSLEVDGAHLSHLHYDLETVPGWQRQSGWRISRQDFPAWARKVLPAYGFNQAAVDGFVQAWAGLAEGSGDLDVYPQPRTMVDQLEPMHVQPSTASTRRVWFLFSPAGGESTPQVAQPHADPASQVDVQEWGVVFDPGAYQTGSSP
jgi:hypothetical protein